MRIVTCGLALILVLLGYAANAQPAQKAAICAMSQEQANKSPLCVRYYFTCEATGVPNTGTGIVANLSMKERERLMLFAVLTLAERNCTDFSYKEALSAMRAKMFGYEGSSP